MTPPVLFAFGLHLHQPVGNFGSVFEQHLDQVYRPLLEALDRGGAWPVTLHVSGPLLDWLERHAPSYLDLLGGHVAAGRIELLLAGYDEPILAVLARDDRLEQLGRMREALRRRFGVEATGLWLTERVWEPDLAEDLARAGVEYALVDDRHFLVAGFEREQLHRPFLTESGGRTVALFPIDERLRYLVPFQPPSDLAAYFRRLRADGAPVAILADDGEKFGGWPGTLEWVYQKGWMTEFTTTLAALRDAGEIRLVTFAEALRTAPTGGLAYLPSASYREMEGWALPPAAALRLSDLETSLGRERTEGPEGALLRGSHWRNFFVKYPESNRMLKKMQALSALCRERGDPAEARRAIGRAQCNDAYWHGVFGGLYLPHLRDAVWQELARAERLLRAGEELTHETIDLDRDGQAEIWIHGPAFSAVVSPARGGAIEEWTGLAAERNWADTLTRRREAYHEEALRRVAPDHAPAEGAAPSIHDLENQLTLEELPRFDAAPRAILQEWLLPAGDDHPEANVADGAALRTWTTARATAAVESDRTQVTVTLRMDGLDKSIRFEADGTIVATYRWEPAGPDTRFVVELSLAGRVEISAPDAERWRYPIDTVAKSEKGFDRTVQGVAEVVNWPGSTGRATLTVRPVP